MYARLIAVWRAGLSPNGQSIPENVLTINALILDYWRFAKTHYLKDGQPTKELVCMRHALRPLRDLYGSTPAGEFGPKALKAVRQHMVDQGLSRGVVNHRLIHSNLGYAYSEASQREAAEGNPAKAEEFLAKAEWHLNEAVRLKPVSPRPRNNLGRVLLRRSQQFEADAREAVSKTKTDPAEAKRLKALATTKLNATIQQFKRAVELDPSLLEARMNLGQVYMSMEDFDKATLHYKAIQILEASSVKDRETTNMFSDASVGLARISLAQNKSDEAIGYRYCLLAVHGRVGTTWHEVSVFEHDAIRKVLNEYGLTCDPCDAEVRAIMRKLLHLKTDVYKVTRREATQGDITMHLDFVCKDAGTT